MHPAAWARRGVWCLAIGLAAVIGWHCGTADAPAPAPAPAEATVALALVDWPCESDADCVSDKWCHPYYCFDGGALGKACRPGPPMEGCCTSTFDCDDLDRCTIDTCWPDGTCTNEAKVGYCEDGDPCTVDTCVADGSCVHADTCSGACCVPNGTPGCADAACRIAVCALNPACCAVAWDGLCAALAGGPSAAACVACDTCGNGVCGPAETTAGCAADCGSACGDGACNGDETAAGCPEDCLAVCGDASCAALEDCVVCPEDCGACAGDCCQGNGSIGCDTPPCQDWVCSIDPFCCIATWDASCGTKASTFLPLECAHCDACGSGLCGPAESTATCPEDCGSLCGDGACNGDEGTAGCPEDCGSACGDGACNGGEACVDCAADCGSCLGGCCEANESIGCDTPACQDAVCAVDPFCCETQWNPACGDAASGSHAADCPQCDHCGNGVCGPAETTATCPGDCGTACGDGVCNGAESGAVCPEDCGSVCGDGACNGEEDCSSCVADCGECPSTCCSESPTFGGGCDDPVCEAAVCAHDSECCDWWWTSACAGTAWFQDDCPDCAGTACGDGVCDGLETCALCPADCGSCTGDCCAKHYSPGCESVACQEAVCAVEGFCCSNWWQNDCLDHAWQLPECSACTAVCGDGVCSPAEGEDCSAPCDQDCGPCTDCCWQNIYGGAGCDEAPCEEQVCAMQPSCCTTFWDTSCGELAMDTCSVCVPYIPVPPPPNDCCTWSPHGSPGCEDATCEGDVCDLDAWCCNNVWDVVCAAKAKEVCAVCGGDPPSNCCDHHPGVGCDSTPCTNTVCSSLYYCCIYDPDPGWGEWGPWCADLAQSNCTVCGSTWGAECCTPHAEPGCPGVCQNYVCSIDPSCCSSSWHDGCASLAQSGCGECE